MFECEGLLVAAGPWWILVVLPMLEDAGGELFVAETVLVGVVRGLPRAKEFACFPLS